MSVAVASASDSHRSSTSTSTSNPHRSRLSAFATANDSLAILILFTDISIYLACVIAAVVVDAIPLKILLSSVAGTMISQLFSIGHDAAHKSYVTSKRANAIIARLVFMPVLHNYTLWTYVHNRLHHAYPNIKGYNSWSPMSFQEYQALPKWRQIVEKIYRSPAGFGPYYLFERWLKDKFFPRKHIPQTYHADAWKDFFLLMVYLFVFVSAIVALSVAQEKSVVSGVLWGAIVPFVFWLYAMGLTVYQQHTSERVKWYKSLSEWKQDVNSQFEVSIHVKYPGWYNFITHNSYYHPVHHVNARIPVYNLRKAQAALEDSDSSLIVKIPFSMSAFYQTIRNCKLYDYDNKRWLDFDGAATT